MFSIHMRTLFLLALGCYANGALVAQDAKSLLQKMYAAVGQVSQSSYTLYSKERFGDKHIEKNMLFHVQEKPNKVYMKDLDSGVEMLYVKGWNGDKAFINPNGFPWVNVSLKITDPRVVKESHHLVTAAGINFTPQLIRNTEENLKKEGKKLEDVMHYKGEVTRNGKTYYHLALINPDFKYISHTVQQDEELENLCFRMCAPTFSVMLANKTPRGVVPKGKVLSMPNSYGKEVHLFLDKNTYLPTVQAIYDDKGLYEYYEFRDMKTNPKFHADEFSSECSCYGF